MPDPKINGVLLFVTGLFKAFSKGTDHRTTLSPGGEGCSRAWGRTTMDVASVRCSGLSAPISTGWDTSVTQATTIFSVLF